MISLKSARLSVILISSFVSFGTISGYSLRSNAGESYYENYQNRLADARLGVQICMRFAKRYADNPGDGNAAKQVETCNYLEATRQNCLAYSVRNVMEYNPQETDSCINGFAKYAQNFKRMRHQ